MDWVAIASILAERSERPIILLDRKGRIRIFNQAMEQALGWRRFHVEGHLWAMVCTPHDLHDEARRWINDALRGALRSYIAIGVTSGGRRLALHFEFSLVGQGAAQGLLATAVEVKQLHQPFGVHEAEDIDYEVLRSEPNFGQLVRLAVNGECHEVSHFDIRCFNVIHNTSKVCEHCPLYDTGEPWPRTSVRYRAGAAKRAFEIKMAEDLGNDRVRVRMRVLPEPALDAIHRAKVEDLAERAQLSQREREVLSYLLLGRTVEDISKALSIAVRTVKYHQASVLGKLGAESRADLMRLLF